MIENISIQDGNILIAHFMECKQIPATVQLKYHESWDWIMPVYDKIAYVWTNMSGKKQGEVKVIKRALQNRLVLAEIIGVWGFTVEFIKWYNNQKKLLNQ